MVVFSCNACNAVLKRNQVDKHCQRCMKCESLSCFDCGKDFWGDDYQNHTKCITEDEKYGGKDKSPKVFKGEAKQEQWVEQVQAAIEKASSRPKLRYILERLRDYPNIPRKKVKFENFVKNSVSIKNPSLITEVWDVLMTDSNKKTQDGNQNGESDHNSKNNLETAPVLNENKNDTNETLESSVPKNKREKKEERRKKAHKKEKKDKAEESVENKDLSEVSKKSKKRKRHELEEVQEQNNENSDQKKVGKLKKNADISVELLNNDDDINNDSILEDEKEDPPPKRKKTKFNWDQVIKSVLEKKGEMSLKKLKKKVLSEFAAQDAANYSEENLSAKFDKKVLRIEGVKVAKDRATLKTK